MEQFEIRSRYECDEPTVSISGGPERIVSDKPDPDFKHVPVGFRSSDRSQTSDTQNESPSHG